MINVKNENNTSVQTNNQDKSIIEKSNINLLGKLTNYVKSGSNKIQEKVFKILNLINRLALFSAKKKQSH